uniref:FBA_2 domain-containing protein n=2 Tax=Caenorhabditis tropicalis TaxID=1561998 RepID=A0A1I7V069_9PELO
MTSPFLLLNLPTVVLREVFHELNVLEIIITDQMISSAYHNSEFGMIVVFKYLFDILPGPVDLSIDLENIRNLHGILINFPKCRNLIINERTLDPKYEHDLYEILDSVKVENEFDALFTQENEIEVDQIKHLNYVRIAYANWLTLPGLLSMKCRKASFMNHKLSRSDLMTFAENWYNSTDQTIEMIVFGWDENDPFVPKSDVLKWKPWNPRVRSKYYFSDLKYKPERQVDCSEGFDITRPDGLTATFLFEDFFDCTVTFFVWHDPYPEHARLQESKDLLAQELQCFKNIATSRNSSAQDKEIYKTVKNVLDRSCDYKTLVKVKDSKPHLRNAETFQLYDPIVHNVCAFKNEISSIRNEINNRRYKLRR